MSSDRGWAGLESDDYGNLAVAAWVAICPRCKLPSLLTPEGEVVPPSKFGSGVTELPKDVETLYGEARMAVSAGAPNSAALACRKILMHVAVEKGAEEDKSFVYYVDWLAEQNYVPPNGRDWIDEIREHGNDANHEIDLMTREEAQDVVEFTAMLLRVVYEYPERGRKTRAARQERRP